jgi:Tfp pilus assembly protein PilO
MSDHHLSNRLRRLDWLFQYLGFTIACVLISIGYGIWHVLDMFVAHSADELTALSQIISQRDTIQQDLQQSMKRCKALEQDYQSLREKIPSDIQETEILKQISKLANQQQLNIREFQPGRVQVEGQHQSREFIVRSSGSYAACCQFIASLQDLPLAIIINECQLSELTEKPGTCQLELNWKVLFGGVH